MADREGSIERDPGTGEEVDDISLIETTDAILDTGAIRTGDGDGDVERDQARAPGNAPGIGLPPEDEEVNPVGSYEVWNQSGLGLDAVGRGMTGDSGEGGLSGTGFEDDADLKLGKE